MSNFKLTPEQNAVVVNRGGTLLVSAAAGSGKTRVLVERVLSRIREEGKNINEFLIITFTNAAAAELREKIADAISDAIGDSPLDRHLQRQRNLLQLAQISTVHAFCAGIIRQYGYQLEIPADYAMLDDTERTELLQQLLGDILEEEYAALREDFCAMADTLGAGRTDSALETVVFSLFEKAQSQIKPEAWLQELQVELPADRDLSESLWGKVCMESAGQQLSHLLHRMDWAVAFTEQDPLLQKSYYPANLSLRDSLLRLQEALHGPWDAVTECLNFPIQTPRVNKYPDPVMKEAVKDVRDAVKEYLNEMKQLFSRPQAELIDEQNTMAPALRGLIRVTQELSSRFTQEKRRQNVLDFSDQEHLAIQLLMDEDGGITDIAKDVRTRYCEIMVDEYQDSNQVQECIFTAISAPGDTNRFLVGDIKQSIYGFREAEPQMFREKYESYPDADSAQEGAPRRLILSRNFRSRPEILEAANHVFEAVMSKTVGDLTYGKNERLYAGRTVEQDSRPHVELNVLLTDGDSGDDTELSKYQKEAEWTAERISSLLREQLPVSKGDALVPAQPEDIAILIRSNDPASLFRKALEKRGIPVQTDGGGNLFETPECRVLLNFLRVADNPHQDIPLLSVLCSPVFHLSNEQLSQLREVPGRQFLYDCMLAEQEPWCVEVSKQIKAWRELAGQVSADELVWRLLQDTGLLTDYCAMEHGSQRRENLLAVYEYARQAAAGRHLYLHELLRKLERAAASGRLTASAAGHGVTITTIHKSKGLEYPIVFLCDLSRKFNQRELRSNMLLSGDYGIAARIVDLQRNQRYPGIAFHALKRIQESKLKSEELRVLYVAMTRPKDYLFMTYASGTKIGMLSDAIQGAGKPAEVWASAAAGCLGDWVLLAAMSRMESGELFARWGQPLCSCTASEYPWRVSVCEVGRVPVTRYSAEQQSAETSTPAVSAAALSEVLNWEYTHPDATVTPSKLTATELKGRVKDSEAAEQTAAGRYAGAMLRPDFILKKRQLTPAEKGTAAHLFLQYADYALLDTPEGVADELIRMVDEEFLTQEQAEAVNPEQILRLFQSELGQRLRMPDRIMREFKFSMLDDASKYYPKLSLSDDRILLQGVVDAAIVEDDHIVVIDFKTDHISPGQLAERSEYYRPQLQLYRNALERITGLQVTECILYYLSTGDAVSLKD